jgi:hypothetical protein
MIERLFRNPKKARIGICVFVVLLLLAFASQCRASELWFEAGTTISRGEAPVIGFALEFPKAGPKDLDYMVGLHLIGEADGEANNAALSLQLVDGFGKFDIGFGICLLHHADAFNGSRANFALSVAYRFGRHAVRERHCSNAGMTEVNKGRDLLLFGRRL